MAFSYLGFRFGVAITRKILTFATNHAPILIAVALIAIAGGVWVFRWHRIAD